MEINSPPVAVLIRVYVLCGAPRCRAAVISDHLAESYFMQPPSVEKNVVRSSRPRNIINYDTSQPRVKKSWKYFEIGERHI